MEIAILTVGLVGFGLGALLTWMAMVVRQERAELKRLVGEYEASAKEQAELRELGRRRHTHRTIAGLEDATALVIDLKIEAEAMEARLETLRRVLGKTREGPESYENSEWREPAG